ERPAVRQALAKAADALPIRIYFHIRDNGDRSAAEDVGRSVASLAAPAGNSIVVPGVQFIPGQQTESLLKCFKQAECAPLGPTLVKLFADTNVQVKLSPQSGFETSDAIRPNHFEAWFAPGLKDGRR